MAPGRGFGLLPQPDEGDVFFNIEGDPHDGDAGLQHLYGVRTGGRFQAFWADDPSGGEPALWALLALLDASLASGQGRAPTTTRLARPRR